jgi:hypothetical protein
MAEPIDWIVAGATIASAGVIAWQAWQTRAAVQASKDTVKAANRSVEVATEALRESQLARLEAAFPRFFVITHPWVDLGAVEQSTTVETAQGGSYVRFEPLTEGRIFKLPRDEAVELLYRQKIEIRNDGPGSSLVELRTGAQWGTGDYEPVVAAGIVREAFVMARLSVAEWVELSETRGVAKAGTVRIRGPKDSDLDETFTVVLTGSVLAPVADAIGDWHVPVLDFDQPMEAHVEPGQRKYWRSRSQNQEF